MQRDKLGHRQLVARTKHLDNHAELVILALPFLFDGFAFAVSCLHPHKHSHRQDAHTQTGMLRHPHQQTDISRLHEQTHRDRLTHSSESG